MIRAVDTGGATTDTFIRVLGAGSRVSRTQKGGFCFPSLQGVNTWQMFYFTWERGDQELVQWGHGV